jgi:hypothetical protein
VSSGYGGNTRQPYVELCLNDQSVQITPMKAREIAGNLLEAAEAAEGDGFLVEFMSNFAEEPEHAVGLLVEFREFREQQRKKQQRWEYPEISAG